jgi:hypothetical protein
MYFDFLSFFDLFHFWINFFLLTFVIVQHHQVNRHANLKSFCLFEIVHNQKNLTPISTLTSKNYIEAFK